MRYKKFLRAVLVFLFACLPLVSSAQSTETITSFSSDIQVMADSSMLVTENIKVLSLGQQIVHGIYRDFPIAYTSTNGRRYTVGFTMVEAKRDGGLEDYRIEKAGNGVRIYLGKADTLLPEGEHEYEITYKTQRQLGYFKDHDELYWNVTGNGWVFPIQAASASVKLPGAVAKEKITAALYTGTQGFNGHDGSYSLEDNGVVFSSARPLAPYEGLTIVVGWPKGVVSAPSAAENFWEGLRSNADYIVGVLGLFLIFIFYYYMWKKYGRDPKKGTVIPLYEPPLGFSPAFLSYVKQMGNDTRGLSAAIINLGVKGALKITETREGWFKKTVYALTKINEPPKQTLSQEEKILADRLLSSVPLKLEKSNSSKIQDAIKDFQASLKLQAGRNYFQTNIGTVVVGSAASLVLIFATAAANQAVRFSSSSFLGTLFWPALFICLAALNITFGILMRAYTLQGRKLADEAEGFKLFLRVTEQGRLNFHNPPERTPELFEKFLPYAVALGVAHEWAGQFTLMFAELEKQGVNYMPLWYYGTFSHFNPDSFAATVSDSFAGAVASASAPPGSSSGFSGGSGGGGGGGGGGGW